MLSSFSAKSLVHMAFDSNLQRFKLPLGNISQGAEPDSAIPA